MLSSLSDILDQECLGRVLVVESLDLRPLGDATRRAAVRSRVQMGVELLYVKRWGAVLAELGSEPRLAAPQ